jgi:hypothetical protein
LEAVGELVELAQALIGDDANLEVIFFNIDIEFEGARQTDEARTYANLKNGTTARSARE